jgi:hypothetical protein
MVAIRCATAPPLHVSQNTVLRLLWLIIRCILPPLHPCNTRPSFPFAPAAVSLLQEARERLRREAVSSVAAARSRIQASASESIEAARARIAAEDAAVLAQVRQLAGFYP